MLQAPRRFAPNTRQMDIAAQREIVWHYDGYLVIRRMRDTAGHFAHEF